MITKKMRYNANKVGFIVQQYPEHKLPDVINLLQMSPVDINTAIWVAQELGFIKEPNAETQEVEFGTAPEFWEFEPALGDLREAVIYSFQQIAKKETDMEENYLAQWLSGYSTQDQLVVMKQLMNERVLAEYVIDDPQLDENGVQQLDEDGEPIINHYTFYCLFENLENRWGTKQFKTNPDTGEDQTDAEEA